MKTPILLGLCILLLASLAQAVTLDSGTLLNTTDSNSSMTFASITVTVDKSVIESTYIDIFNASYTNGELVVAMSGKATWNETNENLDSTEFVNLTKSSLDTKYITNRFYNPINATLTFNVRNCDINSLTYASDTGTYTNSSGWSCSSTANTVTWYLENIEHALTSNTISIDYGDAQEDALSNTIRALLIFTEKWGVIAAIYVAFVILSLVMAMYMGVDVDIKALLIILLGVAGLLIVIGISIAYGVEILAEILDTF